jgi:hypothetical protein
MLRLLRLLVDLVRPLPKGWEHMTLQQRYPPKPGAFVTSYSSIELGDEWFVASPREARPMREPSPSHLPLLADELASELVRDPEFRELMKQLIQLAFVKVMTDMQPPAEESQRSGRQE